MTAITNTNNNNRLLNKDKIMEIPIKNIVLSDWDVRRYPEDEEALDGLILSIQRDGLINPITVTPTTKENNEGYYQV